MFNKLVFLILFLSATTPNFTLFAQVKKEYYDNGTIKRKEIKMNERDVFVIDYYEYPKGVKMSEGKYTDGVKNGKWNYYSTYKHRLKASGVYDMGKKVGKWQESYPAFHINYGFRFPDKLHYYHNTNNEADIILTYNLDSFCLKQESDMDCSQNFAEGIYKNGLREGLWIVKNYKKKKIIEINYVNGLKNGVYKEWFQSNSGSYYPLLEGNLIDDQKEGKWTDYSVGVFNQGIEGSIIEGFYLHSKKDSIWIEWNGDMKSPNSKSKNWNEKGRMHSIRHYSNDTLIGKCENWNYYYDKLQLYKQKNYKKGTLDGWQISYRYDGDTIPLSEIYIKYKEGILVDTSYNYGYYYKIRRRDLTNKKIYENEKMHEITYALNNNDSVIMTKESYYVNDELVKTTVYGYKSQKSQESVYENVGLSYHWTYWKPDGSIAIEGSYLRVECYRTQFNENTALTQDRSPTHDGFWYSSVLCGHYVKIGKWKVWDKEGCLSEDFYEIYPGSPFTNSSLHISYWLNGTKKEEGRIEGDKKQGLWKYWDENGNFQKEEFYLADHKYGNPIESGDPIEFGNKDTILSLLGGGFATIKNKQLNGLVKTHGTEINYRNDIPHGKFIQSDYYVKIEGEFNNGKPVGCFTFLFTNGIHEEFEFDEGKLIEWFRYDNKGILMYKVKY